MTTDSFSPPRLSLFRLFLRFLRFGFLAFGGPVAQIAMVKQALVEEERWISPGRFNRLLAVMQILPGPEAHELCVHLGMVARGRIGGLLAGMLYGLVQIPSDEYKNPQEAGSITQVAGLAALGICIASALFSIYLMLQASSIAS